jgi:hypothetical protein
MRDRRAATTESSTVWLASVTGFLTVAAFVAGKTARDAAFLGAFPIQLLPTFVGVCAVATIPLVLAVSRRMVADGPARLVPALYVASTLLSVGEWLVSTAWPHVAAAGAYLHLGVTGPVLMSAYWSVVSECFDPRSAKRHMGRIGLGAALGGVGGGLLAQATAAWLPSSSILLVVALLQLACAGLLRVLAHRVSLVRTSETADVWEGLRTVARSSLLRRVAVVAVLGAISAAALDYVFKAAIANAGDGPLAALATYYTITNAATVLLQGLLTDRAIARLGVARAVAVLPATVAGFSLAAIAVPRLLVTSIARGAEMIARTSIYRSANELLLSPLAPRDKRMAKLVIDVGADRIGDILGAQLVGLLLLALPTAIPFVAFGVAALAIAVALALPRAYRSALADRLVAAGTPVAATAPPSQLLADTATEPVLAMPRTPALDTIAAAVADVRSGDKPRVERRLAEPLVPELAAHVIPLVAWPAVDQLAARRLKELAPRITGALVDALLDPETEFAVRRRLPAIVADGDASFAMTGLWRALGDARFEVRYRAGKALARLVAGGHALPVAATTVFDAVEREVRVDTRIWRSHRLIDGFEGSDEDVLVYRVLEQRSATALDHVFTLLGLVLPSEPLRIALHALGTDDPALRGTALEYLESVLPDRIRDGLWPFLEVGPSQRDATLSPQALVSELKLSHPSILANLRR